MRNDERGVGGFIEDIPVLVFVLGGVLTLIGTGTWVTSYQADSAREEVLKDLATDTIDRVLWMVSGGVDTTPEVDVVVSRNLSEAFTGVPKDIGWLLSVDLLHPRTVQVLLVSSTPLGNPAHSASESRILNLECDGLCAMARVVVFVWSS